MVRLFFTVFIVLFFVEPQYAADKIKYGKISKDELQLEVCSFDSEAVAVILSFSGDIEVNGSNVLIKKHVRIKILKEGGLKHANINIPYYAREGYEKIYSMKAQTINPGLQGKLEYFEVSKNSMFDADLSEEWKERRFTFPNVKVGSILEYEYTIASENHLYLENWIFQNDLPTLHSELKVEIPQFLDYRLLLQGNKLISKYKDAETNQWELDNLPAIKDEPYLYNQVDYLEMIQFQLSGYYTRADLGGSEYKSLRKTWESLADEILTTYEYRSYLNKSGFAKDILLEMDLKGLDQKDKIRTIYNYVTSNYTWNGKYRRFTYNKLIEIKRNSEAHSSEINLLLTLLLNESGIEAYPMLISTRSNGLYMKDYPFLNQFNHLIVYARTDEGEFFLDALDPKRPYNVLPAEDLISEGFLLDKKEPRWLKIGASPGSVEMYRVVITIDEDESINVKLAMESVGLCAVRYRKNIATNDATKWFGSLLKNKVNINADSIIFENVKDVDKVLSVKADFKTNIGLSTGKGTFYMSPFILDEFSENPFKNDTRYFPIQFPYKHTFKYVCTVVIPEGYELVEVPKSERIKLPNNYGDFTYWVISAEKSLTLQVAFNINDLEIPTVHYQNLKEFYNMLIAKLNQQIIIKKTK